MIALLLVASLSSSAAGLPDAANYDAVVRQISASTAAIKVVNLWATWCAPCVAEMRDLQKLATKFPNVEFIGISLDDAIPGATKKKVADFLRSRGVKYRNIYFTGRQDELTQKFNFEGELPVTFVFGAGGKELTRVVGRVDYTAFTKTLDRLQSKQKR